MNDISTVGAALVLSEGQEQIDAATTTEDRLRVAFRIAKNHWMVREEVARFKSGIGAVMLYYLQAERRESFAAEFERLKRSVEQLARVNTALNAAAAGVHLDLPATLEDITRENEGQLPILPLRNLWIEVNAR